MAPIQISTIWLRSTEILSPLFVSSIIGLLAGVKSLVFEMCMCERHVHLTIFLSDVTHEWMGPSKCTGHVQSTLSREGFAFQVKKKKVWWWSASACVPEAFALSTSLFQPTFLHPPVRATVGEVRYSIEIDVGGE